MPRRRFDCRCAISGSYPAAAPHGETEQMEVFDAREAALLLIDVYHAAETPAAQRARPLGLGPRVLADRRRAARATHCRRALRRAPDRLRHEQRTPDRARPLRLRPLFPRQPRVRPGGRFRRARRRPARVSPRRAGPARDTAPDSLPSRTITTSESTPTAAFSRRGSTASCATSAPAP